MREREKREERREKREERREKREERRVERDERERESDRESNPQAPTLKPPPPFHPFRSFFLMSLYLFFSCFLVSFSFSPPHGELVARRFEEQRLRNLPATQRRVVAYHQYFVARLWCGV